MLKGEFIFADGRVIPNNITIFGAGKLLQTALRAETMQFWVGLVTGVPTQDLQIEDLQEPTIGVNGYQRFQLEQSAVGWPVDGLTNNENFVESKTLTWAATGGNFDKPFRRMMIVGTQTDLTGDVFCLSAALPSDVVITPTTPLASRQLKYRIYLR